MVAMATGVLTLPLRGQEGEVDTAGHEGGLFVSVKGGADQARGGTRTRALAGCGIVGAAAVWGLDAECTGLTVYGERNWCLLVLVQ